MLRTDRDRHREAAFLDSEREALEQNSQAYLAPGENIEMAFRAQQRIRPSVLVAPIFTLVFWPPRIVVVTQQTVLVLATRRRDHLVPWAVVLRHPRDDIRGQHDNRGGALRVGTERLWVDDATYRALQEAEIVSQNAPKWTPIDPSCTGNVALASNIFVVLGMAAFVVGLIDTLTAHNEEYRFVGVAFTFTGALLSAAGIALAVDAWSEHWGAKLGRAATVAGLAATLYLFFSGLGYSVILQFVWVVLGIAVLVAVTSLPPPQSRHSVNPGIQEPKTTVERLTTVGISAGLLFSMFQFWYASGYQPGRQGPSLNISVVLADNGPALNEPGQHAYSATFTVENKSRTRVQVLGSNFTVRGIPIGGGSQLNAETSDGSLSEVLAYGSVVSDTFYFDPDETFSKQIAVFIADSGLVKQRALRLNVYLEVAKGSRLRLVDAPTYNSRVPVERPATELTERNIPNLSLIERLTKGRRAVATLHRLTSIGDAEMPLFQTCIGRPGFVEAAGDELPKACEGETQQDRFRWFYGLVNTGTSYDLPLSATPVPAK